MMRDLMRKYHEKSGTTGCYEILRLLNIDGHEVVYLQYSAGGHNSRLIEPSVSGGPIIQRMLKCECDYTEGHGWRLAADGLVLEHVSSACLKRDVAMQLRHGELRQEFVNRFLGGDITTFDMDEDFYDLVFYLVEKAWNGEWIEEKTPLEVYGSYFDIGTLTKIMGSVVHDIYDPLNGMCDSGLIDMKSGRIMPTATPAPIEWSEYVLSEIEGWVGTAHLPRLPYLAQEWRIEIRNPDNQHVFNVPGKRLRYTAEDGPHPRDIEWVEETVWRALQSVADS